MRLLKFILETSKPYRLHLYVMCFITLIISLDANLKPYLIKLLIDTVINVSKYDLWLLVSIFTISQLCTVLGWAVINCMIAIYIPQYKAHVVMTMTGKISSYSYTFFQNHLSGNIVAKMADIFNLVTDIVSSVILQFVIFGFTVLIALLLLAKIHILFALGLLVWVIFFITITIYLINKKINIITKDYAESRSIIFGFLADYFTNILNVKLFATASVEIQKLNTVMKDFINKAKTQGYLLTKFYFGQGIVVTMYIVGFLFWLIYLYNKNLVTAGDFTLVFMLNLKVLEKMYDISHAMRDLFINCGAVEQAINLLDKSAEIPDLPSASKLKVTRGEIVFDQIKFYYKGTEALFQNKSVIIAPGQKVGLVGYSGSGKSTFVNLILRLYDLIDGKLLIDNQDIRYVTQDSLHEAIGMIPQDPTLFHRSVIENIRCGKLNATYEELIDAAKHAHAHEFIMKLPQGYDSLVGERGVKLSGGQRQRIAIARTILKNAPILILDEATSQLDSMTENNIQSSLWELMQNKTTIVVAHRLSTILHMDRILVFDHGKIVEDGSHQELLAKAGLYKTLWDAQVGGFLLDS